MACLDEFFETDQGSTKEKDLIYSHERGNPDTKILGFKMFVTCKRIEFFAVQGPKYLVDIRYLESTFGLPGTFSYASAYLDFEQYVVFLKDTIFSCGLSLAGVLLVLLSITGSLLVTALVVLSIMLVDMFLYALIYYWGLTFNNIIVINLVVAVGLIVDYSAHIAHTYLVTRPPNNAYFRGNNSRKRLFKAKTALS